MIAVVLILFLAGSAGIVAGAAMISIPAGLISGGALLILFDLLLIVAVGIENRK